MAQGYDRLVVAMKTYADSVLDALAITFGTPTASEILWPNDEDWGKPHARGAAWGARRTLDAMLRIIGNDIDDSGGAHALIATNANGVTPSITGGSGVASASKSYIDTPESLTITLSTAFADTYWCPIVAPIGAGALIVEYTAVTASTLKISLLDDAGSGLSIDNRTIRFGAIGQM